MKTLIIEDDEPSRHVLSLFVEGWEVRQAISLAEGIKLLDEERFELVITDLKLPDSVPSKTVAEVIKHAGSSAVVVVTGMPLTPELEGTADAAIEKIDYQPADIMRDWFETIAREKQSKGGAEVQSRRIYAWAQAYGKRLKIPRENQPITPRSPVVGSGSFMPPNRLLIPQL